MEKTNKSLKEWNAIVEAIGKGKQTILIRKNKTTLNSFLLYPTVNYLLKDDYIKSFKESYKNFVEENLLPRKENGKTEIKYFTIVEDVIEKPAKKILSLDKYYIWHKDHVRGYLNGRKGYIWLLRAYELYEPYMAEPHKGMQYAKLKKDVSLNRKKVVINDKLFNKFSKQLK